HVTNEFVGPGGGPRVIEQSIVELPALQRSARSPRAGLRIRVGAVVAVVVATEGPVDLQPPERLPVHVDVAEVPAGLAEEIVVIERVERVVETAVVGERRGTRVREPPGAVQSGRRAEILLRVEVRRLAQGANPDPVDRVP